MANTIAKAIGFDSSRTKETHRLGSVRAEVEAATWHTFAGAVVLADGSGFIYVERDGKTLARFSFEKETHTKDCCTFHRQGGDETNWCS